MSQGLVERQNLEDIADAIRSKNGSSDTYTPAEMAQAISGIHTADEVVLMQKTVNANGQYNASDDSADGYSGVRVNVPNSYSASDEGKVVSNGDLVSQTTKQITANGTHDTTTNNSVSVDVPNSYAASDNGKVVVNQALVAQTSKNINSNGTHDTTANNSVVVDVPNSYAVSDEGKVVSSGALVEQTSRNVTANGTYDTTENNEVVVNVPTGGGGSTQTQIELLFATGVTPADKNIIAFFDGLHIRICGRLELTRSFSSNEPLFTIPSIYKIPTTQPIYYGKSDGGSIGYINPNNQCCLTSNVASYVYIDATIIATTGIIQQPSIDSSKFNMAESGIISNGNTQICMLIGNFKLANTWVADFVDFIGDSVIAKRWDSTIRITDTATNNGETIGVYSFSTSQAYLIEIYKYIT